MSTQQWLALAAMAILPFAAAQQKQQAERDPAQPDAPAAAFRYESAFSNYRTSADEDQSPDKVWRFANNEMEKLGGHAGHLKDSARQTDAVATGRAATPADHGKHH
jgi:hypothetical protein